MRTLRLVNIVKVVSAVLVSSVAVGYALVAIAPNDETRNIPPINLDETRATQPSTPTRTIDGSGVSIIPPHVIDLAIPPGPKTDGRSDDATGDDCGAAATTVPATTV